MPRGPNHTVIPNDWAHLEYIISDLSRILNEGTSFSDYILKDGSRAYTSTGVGFKDEDDMISDSAVATASQQSIKAYVDDTVAAIEHGDLIGLADDDHGQYFADTSIGTRTANYTTTGTLTAAKLSILGGGANNITILDSTISQEGAALDLTLDTVDASRQIILTRSTVIDSTLTLSSGSIIDSGLIVDFSNNTIQTTGTITGGTLTDGTMSITGGDLTNVGMIGAVGDSDLVTLLSELFIVNGDFSVRTAGFEILIEDDTISQESLTKDLILSLSDPARNIILTEETIINTTLILSGGSITDTTGLIDFGDENLQTTGHLGVGDAATSTSLIFARGEIDGLAVNGLFGGITNTRNANTTLARGLSFFGKWAPPAPAGFGTRRPIGTLEGACSEAIIESAAGESAEDITAEEASAYNSALTVTVGAGAGRTVDMDDTAHYRTGDVTLNNGGTITTLRAFYDTGQTLGDTNWGFYGLSANNFLSGNLYLGQTDGDERITSDADGTLDLYAGTSISFNIGGNNDLTLSADTLDMQGSVITDLSGLHFNSATEITISSGAVTVTQGHHSIDTEGDAANDDLDTMNGGNPGEILLILPKDDNRTVRIRNGVGNIYLKHQVESKSYSFTSPAGVGGTFYSAGFYNWSATDANLTQASLSVTHSAANSASACHIGIVAGGVGVVDTGVVKLTVAGTTIDDEGVRSGSQTVTIVADITTLATDDYVETTEKWIGQVTIALATSSGSPVNFNLDVNYGCSKYEDFGNQAFTINTLEVVGIAGANDTGFNLRLFHHGSTGWTYAATGFIPGGTVLANMNTDYTPEKNLVNGESFAYKRIDLNTDIDGAGSEGLVLEISTSGTKSIEIMDIHLGVHTSPQFSYMATTKQHLIFMKHGSNWLEL